MNVWVYKYGPDAGVVIAKNLTEVLDMLRFGDRYELVVAKLPEGKYHAALLPNEQDEQHGWVSLSPYIQAELEFETIMDR